MRLSRLNGMCCSVSLSVVRSEAAQAAAAGPLPVAEAAGPCNCSNWRPREANLRLCQLAAVATRSKSLFPSLRLSVLQGPVLDPCADAPAGQDSVHTLTLVLVRSSKRGGHHGQGHKVNKVSPWCTTGAAPRARPHRCPPRGPASLHMYA